MSKKRVFVSFAVEDSWARDFLVGQSRNANVPFEFVDMSVKEPWSNEWKTRCRTRIKGCDGMIALVSKHSISALGARWEIRCAHEENIPVLGVHVFGDNRGAIPSELQSDRVIEWTWDGIAAFINRL